MIVKNESKIILRLLESVASIVDSYCICDTGSTDNTVEIITAFFELKGIQGKIVKEPFRDFGYNRTFALNAAAGQPNADFLLLLDADMIFWLNPKVNPHDFKAGLENGDAFYVYQGSDSFYYKNTRIVRNNRGVKYWGVTHEYTELPEGFRTDQLPKELVFIRDIGDGGAKQDKYERDIRLLQRGLLDNPNNQRYLYYLANSYNNGGYPDDAIRMYKKRIEVGGWIEETWQCYYSIGKIYKEKKSDMAQAIWWWSEAFRAYPNRIEQLYEIVKYYREKGSHELAYMYYDLADRTRRKYPVWDYLFMERDIYDYKLDYEFSILGYYCNPQKADLTAVSMKVLADSKVESALSKNTMSNYKFYAPRLDSYALPTGSGSAYSSLLDALAKVGNGVAATWSDSAAFFKSTPSVVALGESTFVVCQRYVNYSINAEGGYEQVGDIITRNVIGIVEEGALVREFELAYDVEVDGVYKGLEDVRLWSASKAEDFEMPRIFYSCNRGLGYSNMVVEMGEIDLLNKRTVKSRHLTAEGLPKVAVEKNWVISGVSSPDSEVSMIYGWKPMIMGKTVANRFVADGKKQDVPDFFRYLRGSTNGIEVNGDLWFLCHAVSYEDRRYYYHILVVLERGGRVKSWTPFFTFSGEKVEYTLGMSLLGKERLLMGYSILDRETKWMVIPVFALTEKMISASR
jgi:glycosyltransferase involved in cell wall biosynthesis